jgi:CBS domain-containing protein
MRDEDTGAVPVVENGRILGMVTDRDIVIRAVADGAKLDGPVRGIVSPDVVCATPEMSTRDASKLMAEHQVRRLPVVENGKILGMVTDRDIVSRAVADGAKLDGPVREIVSSDVVCATPEMSTRDASKLMAEHQVRRLPVVENDRLVGIVSLGDLAVKEGRDSRTGDTLEDISEGVKRVH